MTRELARLVRGFPGESPVFLALDTSEGPKGTRLGPEFRVRPDPGPSPRRPTGRYLKAPPGASPLASRNSAGNSCGVPRWGSASLKASASPPLSCSSRRDPPSGSLDRASRLHRVCRAAADGAAPLERARPQSGGRPRASPRATAGASASSPARSSESTRHCSTRSTSRVQYGDLDRRHCSLLFQTPALVRVFVASDGSGCPAYVLRQSRLRIGVAR